MGFLPAGQAGLELPTPGDPPASASQSAGITGVSHHSRPDFLNPKNHGEVLPALNFMQTELQKMNSGAPGFYHLT